MSRPPVGIVVSGIEVWIDGHAVLHDISLDAPAGGIVGLVGPNGSGKSTLLRSVVGLLRPRRGTITVDGRATESMSVRERARQIAFVPQEVDLPADMLVHEYVALGRLPYSSPWSMGRSGDRAAVGRALRSVGMADHAYSAVDHLSGGERRRVALARGLAQDCGVLVLDEPTNHLDIRHQLDLLALVRTLGTTVLVSLHDLDLAARHCDSVYVLEDGRIRAHGDAAAALDPAIVAEVFGVAAHRILNSATGRTHLVFEPTPGSPLEPVHTDHSPTDSTPKMETR
ncbi:ABC transporter ATP-binding protein [Gordonia terrae]